MLRRVTVAWMFVLAAATGASAQNEFSATSTVQNQSGTQASSSAAAEETRPATTTFFGDTGLWFVPTGEVLDHGKWSVSGYRRGTNYIQGFSNVGDIAGTFAVGIKQRAEIFGSFLVDTRIDRDLRPLFINNTDVGGIVDRDPRVHQGWTGDNVGDFYLGAKINLLSEFRQNPLALAFRGMVKAPTGDKDVGISTGKADFSFDFIGSKEIRRKLEFSGYAGYEVRGKPDGFDIPTGATRWGVGAGFPSRSPLRAALELVGSLPNKDTATTTSGLVVGDDGSLAPAISAVQNMTAANVALTWQHRKGFFMGLGLAWNFPMKDRKDFNSDEPGEKSSDFVDWQIRIGYHPGVRVYVPPPPPPPPLPPPAPAPAPPPVNRPPVVKAQCDPCVVEVGRNSTVTANASDPDGDMLTYRWTSPQGTLASPGERQSLWTAPQQEGTVPVTVTVNDGKGGTASDTVNIMVIRTPVKTYTFEDVHFDFDRYTLRPEATRVLDEAVAAMKQDATLRLQLEGHTCNIGTAEYNLALGDRRANAVRDYLISRGIATGRLSTISYGEERPKYDNAREETRRLNRRAALVVNLQK
ncbi:MAG TPA: OmpA family protein [Gemmataceae bacterium]|nr:OmpA family protein [Gemmataceae bacterium]